MITVVIPTIRGRERDYARCVTAYESRSHHDVRLITIRDLPTCGDAWNAGAAQASPGDYLHFTADDLEPHDGWDLAAAEAVDRGALPAPRIVNAAGELDSCGVYGAEMPDWAPARMSVIPFMSWAQWEQIGPSLPIHYFSDNYLSWRAECAGYPTVVRRGFAFTHHWAQHGRNAGMSYDRRMAVDRAAFEHAKSTVASPPVRSM